MWGDAEAARRAGEGTGGDHELGNRAEPKVSQVVVGAAEPGMLPGPGLPPALTHPVPDSAQLLRLQAQAGLP